MNKEINYVSPFKKLCITVGNLPTAYIESMSYYEGLTFLVNYLSNNVIPALNNNGEVVEEVQAKFTELKNYIDNYFENLDIQEEINNKLDEMAESGKLTDIIAQYLGLAGLITFNNVTEMKVAQNLVNGSKCCTLGFYNVNDGGNAFYKIRTITNDDVVDEMSIIKLYDDNLIAELILDKQVSVKQFGAKGNGIDDDTVAINTALLKSKNVYIPNGTYMITPGHETLGENDDNINYGINVQNDQIINFEKNAILKSTTNNYYNYRVLRIVNKSNVVLNNGKIQGDKNTHTGSMDSEFGHCIAIISSHNITINNMEIYDGMGDGISITGIGYGELTINRSTNITINNCLIHDCRRQGISIISAYNTKVLNTEIYDISGIAPQSCIDIEANYDTNPVEKVIIDNCNLHDAKNPFALIITKKAKDIYVSNCNIENISVWSTLSTQIINCNITDQLYSHSEISPKISNCIMNRIVIDGDNVKIVVNDSLITKSVTGGTAEQNEEIILNNCEINAINTSLSYVFVARALTKLELNNCKITTDTHLTTIASLKTTINNCLINMLVANKEGFYSKNLILKDSFFTGYKIYEIFGAKNDTSNSYIINNIFDTNPDILIRSADTLEQKIYVANNVFNNLQSNIFGGTGSATNLITNNNIPSA